MNYLLTGPSYNALMEFHGRGHTHHNDQTAWVLRPMPGYGYIPGQWPMACMLAEMRLAIIRHICTYEVFIVRSSRSELGQSNHYKQHDDEEVKMRSSNQNFHSSGLASNFGRLLIQLYHYVCVCTYMCVLVSL